MSDVNVTIEAVDNAMDIMDAFSQEVHDLRARVCFEIESVLAMIERKKWIVEEAEGERVSDEEYDVDESERIRDIAVATSVRGEQLKSEWSDICLNLVDLSSEAKREMGKYIYKLNKIIANETRSIGNSTASSHKTFVVIVDSKKYPQTAEHIRVAQHIGLPEIVTLGRTEASKRRKESLKHVKVNSIYDRDEWPMAVFKEGGKGSHVYYLEGKDNRGAGASIGLQLRHFPDGSKVRVRVI